MAEKTNNPGFFARIVKYFRDAKGEFKKIGWPSKKQVWNNVLVILVMVLVFSVLTWGVDYILAFLRNLLLSSF